MISFPVSPEKQKALFSRMEALGLKESDLQETFIRSSGKGGQNVNKVSTAVFLKHILSNTEVKCSIYRTQGLNRYKARVLLCEKLEEKTSEVPTERSIQISKIQKKKSKKEKRQKDKYPYE
jgi:peptide chain release factor